MLRGIHKASANWLGRVVLAVILGLIAISFAIWGIGDIFRGFGQTTLAKVGRTEIGIEQFRLLYSERLQDLSRRIGRPITSEQARALGFDRQILSQVLAETVLDERARELGLGVSDAEIAKRIAADPNFRGIGGQFDHNRFLQIIRQAGYTEQRYVAEQRRLMLRQQLVGAVTGQLPAPKAAVEVFNRFQNEQRAIEYVVLDRAQAGELPTPTPEVLAKYYEERKALFRAPEYRKLLLLVVTPEELLPAIEVPDADLRRGYEERKSRYVTPERRHVEQIMFANMEQARAAAERLAKGLTFARLAAEQEIKDKYTDLGTVPKAAIIDRAIADAAFALKQGEVSAPVQGRFGVTLVHVGKIEPGQVQPFEKVAAELKREIALERARREVQTAHDKIEDERLDGKTLEQVAQKLALKLRVIEATDRSGRAPDGTPVAGLPENVDVLGAAFASDVGAENEPLRLQDGGFAWYEVVSVTPSRERPLAEITEQIEARWRDDEIAKRLNAKAGAFVDKLKAGASMADLASKEKLKVQTAKGIKRGQAVPGIPLRALSEIFRTAKGAAGIADGEKPTDRIVFRVVDSVTPPLDPAAPEAKRFAEALRRAFADDLLGQYLARLQTDVGVNINENALRQVTGGGAN